MLKAQATLEVLTPAGRLLLLACGPGRGLMVTVNIRLMSRPTSPFPFFPVGAERKVRAAVGPPSTIYPHSSWWRPLDGFPGKDRDEERLAGGGSMSIYITSNL